MVTATQEIGSFSITHGVVISFDLTLEVKKVTFVLNISLLSIPTLPLIDWQTPLNDYKTLFISLGCVMTLIQYDLCLWLRSQRKHDEYLYPIQVLNARVPIT